MLGGRFFFNASRCFCQCYKLCFNVFKFLSQCRAYFNDFVFLMPNDRRRLSPTSLFFFNATVAGILCCKTIQNNIKLGLGFFPTQSVFFPTSGLRSVISNLRFFSNQQFFFFQPAGFFSNTGRFCFQLSAFFSQLVAFFVPTSGLFPTQRVFS